MTYNEARELSYKVPWVTKTCSQGEICWCRIVVPKEPILFSNGEFEEEYYIIGSGAIAKDDAEYFVELHNSKLNEDITRTQK